MDELNIIQNKSDLISVIIPVYNRKNYLDRCISSAIKQDGINIEIIIIDDGSTDGSAEMIDSFAGKYSNIVAVHQKNMGVSAARNKGLEICRGSYICFLDSDDYLADDALKNLYKNIKKYNVDICIGNYCKYYDNGELESVNNIPKHLANKVISTAELLSLMYVSNSYLWDILWAKLYKRDVFKNVCFPSGSNYEDEYVISDIIEATTSIYLMDNVVYHQTLSTKSIMRSSLELGNLKASDAVNRTINYLIDKGYYDFALYRFGEGTRQLIAWKNETNDKRILEEWKKKYRLYCTTAKRLIPNVRMAEKMRLILFCFNLRVYAFVRNKMRKNKIG